MIARVVISAVFILLISNLRAGKIVYPWRAATAIVKAGESFEVWFDADNGQTVSSVELQGPYNTVSAAPDVVIGDWFYDQMSGNRYDTRITVTVPEGSPADRYDLILQTSTQDEASLGAVKVVSEYRTDYFIMHISDTHAYQSGNNTVLDKISGYADIADIIDPPFIFVTGDNMYNVNDGNVDKYFNGTPSQGLRGIHGFHAATFMAAGNHDAPGNNYSGKSAEELAKFWNQWFGVHTCHFSYGEGRFMVLNDGWSVDHSPQVSDFAVWLDQEGTGNLRVGACHKLLDPGLIDDWQRAADLHAILGGHNHHKGPTNPHPVNNKPVAYVANSAREYFKFNLFKVDGAEGTFTPLGEINSDNTTAGFGLPTGMVDVLVNPADHDNPGSWVPNLTINYANENDGSSSENTATIVSQFDFPIPGARVRFVMQPGDMPYGVSEGAVEQAFDGESVRVVDVRVDLGADAAATVDIFPDASSVPPRSERSNVQARITYTQEGIRVHFPLAAASRVDAGLYGLDGRLIRRIAQKQFGPGEHALQLPHSGPPAAAGGAYFLKLDILGEHSPAPESRLVRVFIP